MSVQIDKSMLSDDFWAQNGAKIYLNSCFHLYYTFQEVLPDFSWWRTRWKMLYFNILLCARHSIYFCHYIIRNSEKNLAVIIKAKSFMLFDGLFICKSEFELLVKNLWRRYQIKLLTSRKLNRHALSRNSNRI